MRRRLIGTVTLLVSLALVAVAGWWLWSGDVSSGDVAAVEDALRPEIPAPVELGPAPATTTPPAETEAEAGDSGADADNTPVSNPVGLRIDKLAVAAPVDPYGVDRSTGEMDVPDNATDVAWYRYGPKPGEPGSAVLAAHVDLASSGPGVFFDLRTLSEGDSVVVDYEDGSEARFRVVARVTYDKDELPLDVIFSREGPPVLTLITCGGGFNSNIARYDSNVVVYAVPDLGNVPTEGITL